jgi:hypothetical protein
MMKVTKYAQAVVFTLAAAAFSACASQKAFRDAAQNGTRREAAPAPWDEGVEAVRHKGTDLGIDAFPVWLQTYRESGQAGLENLPDYSGFYCFVGKSAGKDLSGVQAWAEDSAEAETISAEIQARLYARCGKKPGAYIEGVIKRAAAAPYTGFSEINRWWVETRAAGARSGAATAFEIYVFYTIEKERLDRQLSEQINLAIDATPPSSPAEQKAAAQIRAAVAAGL